MMRNTEGRSSGGPLLGLLVPAVVLAAAVYIYFSVPLVYPPTPPLPPGEEYVLDPAWKITIHHYLSLRLHPPPPLTGAD